MAECTVLTCQSLDSSMFRATSQSISQQFSPHHLSISVMAEWTMPPLILQHDRKHCATSQSKSWQDVVANSLKGPRPLCLSGHQHFWLCQASIRTVYRLYVLYTLPTAGASQQPLWSMCTGILLGFVLKTHTLKPFSPPRPNTTKNPTGASWK